MEEAVNDHTLSIDPGDKRIGVALFSGAQDLFRFTFTLDAFMDYLCECAIPKRVVCEDYSLDHGRNKGGSKMLSSQVIGMVKLRAFQWGVPVDMQPSTNLRLWALHEGIKLGAGHIPDDMSAFLHGAHRLHELGIRKPKAPTV